MTGVTLDVGMPLTSLFIENVRILIEISLKFVPKDPINNIPSLVQIMACHQPGD